VAEALNREDVEALVGRCDPSVEWHPAMQALLGGEAVTYRGHAGVREMMSDFYEAFAELSFEISEIHDLGDRVVPIGRINARGKGSGAEVESPAAYLVDFRNGKVIEVRTYLDPGQALKAAGLQE
jgi:ketosteroid isomerase-like protein